MFSSVYAVEGFGKGEENIKLVKVVFAGKGEAFVVCEIFVTTCRDVARVEESRIEES